MNDLLSAAVNSHGGPSRWSQLKTVTATLSITGAIWEVKGKPDALKDVSIEAQPQKESLTTHFNGQDKRTVFDPNRITVQTESGRIVSSRNDPRSAFRGHTLHTSWDDMPLVYCHTPKALLVSLQNTSPRGDDNLLSASDEGERAMRWASSNIFELMPHKHTARDGRRVSLHAGFRISEIKEKDNV